MACSAEHECCTPDDTDRLMVQCQAGNAEQHHAGADVQLIFASDHAKVLNVIYPDSSWMCAEPCTVFGLESTSITQEYCLIWICSTDYDDRRGRGVCARLLELLRQQHARPAPCGVEVDDERLLPVAQLHLQLLRRHLLRLRRHGLGLWLGSASAVR